MITKLKQYSETWLDWAIKIIFLLCVSIMMIFILSWRFPRASQFQLEPGQVSPSNIVAPTTIVYESVIETQRARIRAAQAVDQQYDIPEGRIRRQQVDRSREILEFISTVRHDIYATPELQTDYLSAIPDLNLRQEVILEILNASDEQWADVVTEVPLTLGRVMREEIRDNENAVALARRRVQTLTDSNLSETTSEIVVDLVRNLIRPNSFLNEERTEKLRKEAFDDIPAQLVRYEQGEMILRAGDIVTEESVEALEQIGILQGEWNWWVVGRAFFFTIVLVTAVIGALSRLYPLALQSNQIAALLTLAAIVWLLLAKFMIIAHDWLPYLYPLATLGMLIAVLVNIRVGLIYTIAFTFIVLYLGTPNTFLATILGCLGSLFGALILGRAERLAAFLWSGFAIALSNLFIFAAFRAPFQELTTSQLSQIILVMSLNGGLSASIALIGYFFLGNVFGITTSLQLTELSRPTHPLLRQLVLKSPGTYNHTIIVSNLAERAAAAIGADALLTRVGAYYHDIGKSVRPYFFIENKADGAKNSHDKLDPLTSAQIIISHVADGLDLAQKYRLPTRLQDFIREHHGKTYVQYFYNQALKAAREDEIVNESQFRYPGPSPKSKETAILALADTCESAIRAIKPATRTDMANLINKLIDDRVASGDLNECDLTFKELQTVKDIFVQVLQGVHHPRIVYPDKAKPLTENQGAQTNEAELQAPQQPNEQIQQPMPNSLTPLIEA